MRSEEGFEVGGEDSDDTAHAHRCEGAISDPPLDSGPVNAELVRDLSCPQRKARSHEASGRMSASISRIRRSYASTCRSFA